MGLKLKGCNTFVLLVFLSNVVETVFNSIKKIPGYKFGI